MRIEAKHIRMARAGLNMTVAELCKITGLHRNTLVNIEGGKPARESTLVLLKTTFESKGVVFSEHGVTILE